MTLDARQRWHAAQATLDWAREAGVAAYWDDRCRGDPRAVFEFPAGLDPGLKEQFEREFTRFAAELRELLRP
jgi:hypothetical protein